MTGALTAALDIVERFDAAKSAGEAGRLFYAALEPFGAVGFGARAYDAAGGSASWMHAPGIFASIPPKSWTGSSSGAFVESLDPLPGAARRLRRPAFLWSDASPKRDRKWNRYWEALGEHGIADGTAVHLFAPGGVTSRVTLAFADGRLEPRFRKAVELASYALLDRMLTLSIPKRASRTRLLSPRERDCMSYAAQGLTDAGIAANLGITEATAHFYVEQAKKKLGVRTRAQAVAQLIAAGVL
jgi:DNA-binding CsgD family transcriptional regulator